MILVLRTSSAPDWGRRKHWKSSIFQPAAGQLQIWHMKPLGFPWNYSLGFTRSHPEDSGKFVFPFPGHKMPMIIENPTVNTIPAKQSSDIPTLADYGIDAKTGFLPSTPPLSRLPEYFEPWESLLDDLSHYLLVWKLRKQVEKVCFLNCNNF